MLPSIMPPPPRQHLPPTPPRILPNPRLQLGPKMPNQPLNRPRKRLPQRANRMPLDLLRQLLHHINLPLPRLPRLEPLHNLVRPLAPLAAGRALPAGLVVVEFRQAGDGADHVSGLVHDDYGGGAEAGLGVL